MNEQVIKECTILSDEEKISFPEVVGKLIGVGVDLYYADFLSGTKTYYAGNEARTVKSLKKHHQVAEEFNPEGIQSAIKDSQSQKIKYQEFVRRAMEAGVVSYMVFVKGKKAVYFGKKGEQHIEEFPKSR